ncbi:MAG TPA: ABC transporter permease subunit [Anaerolineales bacterium]|nr:ABC transporter permease subunit [Anaerolineales bacterium]
MSDASVQLSNQKTVRENRLESSGRGRPAWWLVFIRELTDLWVGGKALVLVFIYAIFLGVVTYVIASNSELSLIPPKEMVYETIKNVMAVSLFIGLIIGADSLSGERERNTLESLLLTPTSRRQIVAGKFLAAITFWPAAFVIAIPSFQLLSQGDEVFGQGLLWGGLLGTVMVLGYVGIGMLVSFWSGSNKTSYFVSLGIYILFLVPAQLPGKAQTGVMGQFLQWINPIAAVNHFLSKILVNNIKVSEFWVWLQSPVVFALIVLGVLFLYAGPGLRLENGRKSKFWSRVGRAFGLGVIVALLLVPGAATATALQTGTESEEPLQISIDMESKSVRASESIFFNTTVTNSGAAQSVPLIVAMNIINLDAQGEIVDPEDWSPQRTQYIERLGTGESATLEWRVNAILDGDYMVYMVVIPQPNGQNETSHPIASPGIHLIVTPFTKLNPSGVLPFAVGIPIVLLVIIYFVNRNRNRQIDMGGSA